MKLLQYYLVLFLFIFLISCTDQKARFINQIPDDIEHLDIDPRVKSFLLDIKNGDFELSTSEEGIDSVWRSAIGQFYQSQRDPFFNSAGEVKFEYIYTFDPDYWASSCISSNTEPRCLIDMAFVLRNKLGLSYTSGGFANGKWFELFEFNQEGVNEHCVVQLNSFDLKQLIPNLLKAKECLD